MNNSKNNKFAKQAYKESTIEIIEKMNIINKKLLKHQESFVNNSNDWRYVGDLNLVKTVLDEINKYI